MKPHLFSRLTAVSLSLSLLAVPAAHALTTEQAAYLLQTYYVDELPKNVLTQPTVPEMLNALGDPYTEYFSSEEYTAFTSSLEDTSLVGIGIAYLHTEDGLLLSGVTSGGPAEAGGLQAGDLIVAVDGQSVLTEPDTDVIASWFKGKEGSKVKVTYRRDNVRRTVTLTRALIVIPATSSQLVNGHIGYIDCGTFGEETYGHFLEAIDNYGEEADVWIVDLRSNLGGITNAAVDAAGVFIGEGTMLYFRDGSDSYEYHPYEESASTDAPLLVLVDEHTASAAEIFAAAIQSYGRGVIIGERTFGKGVAQTVFSGRSYPEYFADGDALKITSHRFFSPSGNTTDQIGVIPDLLMESSVSEAVALLLAENTLNGDCNALRLPLCGEIWSIDLDQADPETMTTLLETLPVTCELKLKLAGSRNWEAVSTTEVADLLDLELQTVPFTDEADSLFPEALSVLKTYGMIHGIGDSSFQPQNSISRAELCQMLASALNCTVPENSSSYSDVDDSAWYAPAVLAVSNMGLVKGMGDGRFCPEDPVDCQQLITIIGRLATRLNMFLYEEAAAMPENIEKEDLFTTYANWAVPSVCLLSETQQGYFGNTLNLLWDAPENIEPTACATREQAAFLLYRLLTHIEVLPPV